MEILPILQQIRDYLWTIAIKFGYINPHLGASIMVKSSSSSQNAVLDSLADPSYRKEQDPKAMSKPIQFYFKNVTEEIIGPEHGLSKKELDKLAAQIAEITRAMA